MPLRAAWGLLRRPVLRTSLAVQGLGSLATLALGLLIAWAQGPQAQGHYGLVRTTADLLLALTLLGLPQGLVHVIHHLQASPSALWSALRRYCAALAGAAVALALAFDLGALPPWLPADLHGPGTTAALAVGVLGWTVHGLQRSMVLCLGSTLSFSWLTSAPALTLLLAVSALLAMDSSRYEWAVAVSGVCSLLWGGLVMRPLQSDRRWTVGAPTPWPSLLAAGLHATLQTVAVALQPWLALWLLRALGATPQELGWFVLAGYVQQVFALPANFVMPLLFARASRAAGAKQFYDVRSPLVAAGVLTVLAAGASAAVLPSVLPAVLGPAYLPALDACLYMALAGPAVLLGRLGSALLLGQGRFQLVTLLLALRVMLMGAAIVLPLDTAARAILGIALDRVAAAALAWALSELLTTLLMFSLLRGRPQAPAEASLTA